MSYKVPQSLYATRFVDRIVVGGNAPTSVSFGTGGNGQFNRALDGNVDTTYILECAVVKPANGSTVALAPNGIGLSASSRNQKITVSDAGTISGAGSSGPFALTVTAASSTFWGGRFVFAARTGQQRYLSGYCIIKTAAGVFQSVFETFFWADTTTNITSLVLDFGGGTYSAGTRYTLWKRPAPA